MGTIQHHSPCSLCLDDRRRYDIIDIAMLCVLMLLYDISYQMPFVERLRIRDDTHASQFFRSCDTHITFTLMIGCFLFHIEMMNDKILCEDTSSNEDTLCIPTYLLDSAFQAECIYLV